MILMLIRIQLDISPLHLNIKAELAEEALPRTIRKHGTRLEVGALGDDVVDARGDEAALLPELARAAVQDGRVGVVDGAAGRLPLVGHAVVGRALEEQQAVAGVEDDGAGGEGVPGLVVGGEPGGGGHVPAGDGGVEGEVELWGGLKVGHFGVV